MLILYPDTNALYGDLLMLKPNSRQLIEGLLEGHVEVALSPVVVAEAQRQARETAEQVARELAGSTRGIEHTYGVPTADARAALGELAMNVKRVSSAALGPLLTSSACRILPWPDVDSEELVMRELDRRLPARIKNGQSIGLRDTIIWHGLVDLIRSIDETDEVLFVTADTGFTEDGLLARTLLQELEKELDVNFDGEEPVRVVTRLESALIEVKERREDLTRQEGLILQAVVDQLASLEGMLWTQVDRFGTAPLRYGIEEGLVSSVDSITIDRTVGTPPTTIEATADVTVMGSMRTDEYLQEYSDDVEWIEGELYDPMISVQFTATIRLEAEVELADTSDDAWVTDETLTWVD